MTDIAPVGPSPRNPRVQGLRQLWRGLALLWLAVVLVVGWHQWNFWQQPAIDSDVLALLPRSASDAVSADAVARIADASSRQVFVLLGARDAEAARRAEEAYRQALRQGDGPGLLSDGNTVAGWYEAAQAFYAPYREGLLASTQRQALQETPVDMLAQHALASLYGLPGQPRMLPWAQDPMGLWAQWWQLQASASGLQADADGLLRAEGRHWTVLQFDSVQPAFQLDGGRRLQDALDAAASAARGQVPDLRELRAGVPLHAEAAAVQASREINTIGWGSLAAVLLLTWLAFRSTRPILLVASSLLVGCAVALSVTVLWFGQVHLLTLVFGASLVGVAEDYGIHWFASRQSGPEPRPWSLLPRLLPSLSLALATSAIAYLALGLAPFPGLRQMAMFSVVGLSAAFITVILWFPWLDRGQVRENAFSHRLGASLVHLPRVQWRRGWQIAAVVLAVFSVVGLMRLQPLDDLRSLHASPPELMVQQRAVGTLLGLSSPAQFYLVQGADTEQVLQREEALVARLEALKAASVIDGHRALSDWLPSRQRQQTDRELVARIETAVVAQVAEALDEPLLPAPHDSRWLDPEHFFADPVSRPFRSLWLGRLGDGVASTVMVTGVSGPLALEALSKQGEGLGGVRWVDRTADYSVLLGHYRRMMGVLLVAGLALVGGLLAWRYRSDAWRTLAPTVLAGVLTVSLLGWLGQPLQLFNVLALLLLLGMGIDYSVFLTEHSGDPGAWLAVCIGGASTWLSFGLLSLSATPALHAFGLTLLLGIGLVWLISPLFRPVAAPAGTSP